MRKWSLDEKREQMRDHRKLPSEWVCVPFLKTVKQKGFLKPLLLCGIFFTTLKQPWKLVFRLQYQTSVCLSPICGDLIAPVFWVHCGTGGYLWHYAVPKGLSTHLLFFFFFNNLHFPWRDLRGRLYDPIFTKHQMNKTNTNEIKTTYLMIVAMVSWFLPVLIGLSCHPRAILSSLSSRPDLGSQFGPLLTVCSGRAAWDSLPSES